MRIIVPLVILLVAIASYFLFFAPSGTEPATDNQITIKEKPTTPTQPQTTTITPTIRKEAEKYISDLSATNATPLPANDADDFILSDQTISLGKEKETEDTTLENLLSSGSSSKSPITLVETEEQITYKTSEQILLDADNNLQLPVKILDEGNISELTVKELLQQYPLNEIENIAVIEEVENYTITTVEELKNNSEIDPKEKIRIIKGHYTPSTTSVAELLMGEDSIASDDVFYVRNIDENDQEGIWGVIQNGLIKTFAKGIAIRRDEAVEKYQVMIPESADEKLDNNTSSFLGRLIQQKTTESYVYNFDKGKMGRNPDLIFPGQELAIIHFKPDELVSIYHHFVTQAQ